MTGPGQRFETIIAVCSSVVPFICGSHNNAIILLTAFVGKEILWALFFSWGNWEGICWCRESWAEPELGLSSSDSYFVVLRARTHQLVRSPWLFSACRTFVSSVFTLHLEEGKQSPQTGNPEARMSTSPQKAQHYGNWREGKKELSYPRPKGSCKCSSANVSVDYDLNPGLDTANIQWRVQSGFK